MRVWIFTQKHIESHHGTDIFSLKQTLKCIHSFTIWDILRVEYHREISTNHLLRRKHSMCTKSSIQKSINNIIRKSNRLQSGIIARCCHNIINELRTEKLFLICIINSEEKVIRLADLINQSKKIFPIKIISPRTKQYYTIIGSYNFSKRYIWYSMSKCMNTSSFSKISDSVSNDSCYKESGCMLKISYKNHISCTNKGFYSTNIRSRKWIMTWKPWNLPHPISNVWSPFFVPRIISRKIGNDRYVKRLHRRTKMKTKRLYLIKISTS